MRCCIGCGSACRERVVGTGLFWQKALAEEKARWRWRRWRSKVSLAVQMLIVVLLALAAAGPQIPPPKRIVLVIDNSATMRATDVQPTRLDAAKEVARRLIESLRSCDEMAVVTVVRQPTEVQPLTSDQALLTTAVDSVQATDEPPAIEWAVKLAREIPACRTRAKSAADRADHRRLLQGSRKAGTRERRGSAARRHGGGQPGDNVLHRAAEQGRADEVRGLRGSAKPGRPNGKAA